jgi:hypothetical protein
MARAPSVKSLEMRVDRLDQQVCTLMAYVSFLEQNQRLGIEERFLEAAAKKLHLEDFSPSKQSVGEIDYIHSTATYLARGQAEADIQA